ncbi:MAG: class I SAM-dependent methyltransferase [Pseudomonadota bacterium]
MTKSKDARFWDKAADKYARDVIADEAGYQRSLARTREWLKPTDHVLEIGCGTGTTALYHAPQVDQLVGTDISPRMVAIARDKLATDHQPNVRFEVASASDRPVPASSQDVVMAHNILHLVSDLGETLAAIHASLKPGGLLIAKTPCLGRMNPILTQLVIPTMRFIGKAPCVVIFKPAELHEAIKRAGFEIEAEEYHGSAEKGRDFRPYIVARKGLSKKAD